MVLFISLGWVGYLRRRFVAGADRLSQVEDIMIGTATAKLIEMVYFAGLVLHAGLHCWIVEFSIDLIVLILSLSRSGEGIYSVGMRFYALPPTSLVLSRPTLSATDSTVTAFV